MKLVRTWSAVGGAIVGFIFGQINVIWATLYETETRYHIIISGVHYDTPRFSSIIIKNPNLTLVLSTMLFSGLGLLIAHSFTHRDCCACGGRNPEQAKLCQFCGEVFLAPAELLCPKCNEHYINGAKFCPDCAVALITPEQHKQESLTKNPPITKTCTTCGATNLPQRSHCHRCAKPV